MAVVIDGTTGITDADGGAVLSTADIASQAQAETGTDNATLMTPLRVAQAITAQTSINYQQFTSGGTWTKPSGVSFVYVQAIGGGGGGASRSDNNFSGGGGGGGYVDACFEASSVGATETVTIGAGGAAGVVGVTGGSGGNGGNTTFGSLVTALGGEGAATTFGGAGGGQGTGGRVFTATQPVGNYMSGSGGYGNGMNGVYSVQGGGGGGGCGDKDPAGAGGASANAGSGGASNRTASVAATNGSAPGGGGGGSCNGGNGGAGAAGRVRVWAW